MLRNLNYSPAPGVRILGTTKVGVLGSAIPSGGVDGASFIYPSLSLPADAEKYYRGYVTSRPAHGVLTTYEDGSFEFDPQGFAGTQTFSVTLYENGVALTPDIVVTLVSTSNATVTSVTVSPTTANVSGGGTVQFSASVAGTNSPPQSVTWETSAGSISSSGLLTAPAGTSVQQTVTVTARSTLDPTKIGTATVTVAAVAQGVTEVTAVTVAPASANLAGGATQQFVATVIGTGNPPQTVVWSASDGQISVDGLYEAPAASSQAQTVTVSAASTFDLTKVGQATVTVAAALPTTGYPDPSTVLAGVQYGAAGEFFGTYVPEYVPTPAAGQLSGQNAIDMVLRRIGRANQAQYREPILLEMRLIQDEYAQGPNPPWFLHSTRTFTTVPQVNSIVFPSDFLRFDDDDAFVSYAVGEGSVFPKIIDINILRSQEPVIGLPMAVAVWDRLYLWPVPDRALQLKVNAVFSPPMIADTPDAPAGGFLKYAPYLLIAKAAQRVATHVLQDFDLADRCAALVQEAEIRVARFSTARRHSGIEFDRGDDSYER